MSFLFEIFDIFIGFLQTILTFFYGITESIGYANYGLAIILLTIAIKMLLYPLTVKQVRSMKGMQILQPKMKELQEKYSKQPEKLQKELAILYKETGVNPLAGCLPMLVQMPILIGIFYAIRDFSYVSTPSFLWLQDLSAVDPTWTLPAIAAISTYIQSTQTSPSDNKQAKVMTVLLPLFIGYISTTFPSGLVLYWAMSNIVQIAQTWWMYRMNEDIKREAA